MCVHCSFRNAREYNWPSRCIILAADFASNGIYNFVVPLRAHFHLPQTLRPIILLLEKKYVTFTVTNDSVTVGSKIVLALEITRVKKCGTYVLTQQGQNLHISPNFTTLLVMRMDVLSNGLSISAKKESQLLCCIMGKRCHFDVTFWLLMVGDW